MERDRLQTQNRSEVRCGWSKSDLTAPKSDFRFTPESGLRSDIAPCPKSAISGSHSILVATAGGC